MLIVGTNVYPREYNKNKEESREQRELHENILVEMLWFFHFHSDFFCAVGGFSQEELLKIWKGLFYCMWMQDKPLLQVE